MRLALSAHTYTARKVTAEDVLGRVEELLTTYLPDEESSDSQNEGYEFMLQTMGWQVAKSINSLGQDKRDAVFVRLRRINPEVEGCTLTQSQLWSSIIDEFETLHAKKATRYNFANLKLSLYCT